MNRIVFLLFVNVLSCGQNLIANAQGTDSLKIALEDAVDADLRFEILDRLGKEYLRNDPLEAMVYYSQYLSESEASGLNTRIAYAYNQLGICHYYNDDIKASSEAYFKALENLEEGDDNILLMRIYNNVGWNFQVEQNLDLAIEYFLKAEDIARRIEDSQYLGLVLNNLGVAYKNMGNYTDALSIYEESLEINKADNNIDRMIFNLNNMGIVNTALGEYDQALSYLNAGRGLISQTKDSVELINYMISYGDALVGLDEFQKALDSLELGLQIAKNKGFVNQKLTLLFKSHEVNKELGRYEISLSRFKEYYDLNLEQQLEDDNEFITELKAKYDVSQKENELQRAENQNLIQRLYILIITAVLVILTLGMIFVYRTSKIKSRANDELKSLIVELEARNKTIEQQNQSITQKSDEIRLANQEVKRVNANLEKLVEERTQKLSEQNVKLAQFSHMIAHDLRGPLARILGLLDLVDVESTKETQKLSEMLKISAKELDDIIHLLHRTLREEGYKES